jgi:5-methyltetrahydropteroyltriglutamate--homocysteine methyltransferase
LDIDAFLWGHRHGDDAVGEQRRRDRLVKLGVVSRLVRKRRLVAEQGRVDLDPPV